MDSALKRALAKLPMDRFASATDFITGLSERDEDGGAESVHGSERTLRDDVKLRRTNLPVQATPLVRRQRELAEVGALIDSHRLVTPWISGERKYLAAVRAAEYGYLPVGGCGRNSSNDDIVHRI